MRQYPDFLFVKDRPLMPSRGRFWRLRTVKTTRFMLYERVGFNYYGQRLEIPWGFASDFASIPRVIWWLIPPHGLAALPSVKHDYLYDERIGQKQYGDTIARLMADQEFYRDCLAEGMPRIQAWLMYKAIRVFARSYWIH